jgi:type IV pilus assembly protein PilA
MCDPECIKIKHIKIQEGFRMNQLLIKKRNEVSKKKKKGFTLVELIIVIAIIAILAAIAIPRFGEIREGANVRSDIANAKDIQTAATAAVSNGTQRLDNNVDIATIMNGGVVPLPKSRQAVAAGGGFVARVDQNGTVIVTAGGIQIFPTPAAPYDIQQ